MKECYGKIVSKEKIGLVFFHPYEKKSKKLIILAENWKRNVLDLVNCNTKKK